MLFIEDADVAFDGHGSPGRRRVSLVADGDRILAVGGAAEVDTGRKSDADRVIDARGMTLIPGLVDAHVHLALAPVADALRNVATQSVGELAARAVLNAQRCLAAGSTTLWDCGAPGRLGTLLSDLARTDAPGLPRILVAGPCLTTTGGHGETIGVCADSADELRRRVRELCRDGVDFIKLMVTGGSSDPQTNRGRAQYSVDELSMAIRDAHRLGRKTVCHANGTEGIRNAAFAGSDVIAHCNWLAPDGQTLLWDEATADQILAQRIAIDLNVAGALTRTVGRGAPRRWEVLTPLREGGAPVYITSDGFGEGAARFAGRLVEVGTELSIPVAELIQRTTTIPAAVLELRELARGMQAGGVCDLVLLDGDLERDVTALARPRYVIAGGSVVAVDGAVVMDEVGSR